MKKRVLLIISICLSVNIYAQFINDSILCRVHYLIHFKRTAEQKELRSDERVLEIGKNTSKFYSLISERRKFLTDSISKRGGQLGDVLNAFEKEGLYTVHNDYTVYKHFPSKGKYTFRDDFIDKFQYVEDLKSPSWEILPTDTVIGGYKCQKATSIYKGRHWTVWFAPELKWREGPWLLHGLPGLILHAQESKGEFSFSCIGIKKVKGIITVSKKKYVNVTKKRYKEMMTTVFKDPYEIYSLRGERKTRGYDAHGKPLVYKPLTAVFIDNE